MTEWLLWAPGVQPGSTHHTLKSKRKLFYCESGQILEQVGQRDCVVYILGYSYSLTGHGVEQSALVDPTLSYSVANYLEHCFATTRADAAKQSFFSFSSLLKNNN